MSRLYERIRGTMGFYFNPGNESYRLARKSDVYVDKTGLLMQLNRMIGTERRCIALSHARRFGKSQAAGMIDAYYSLGSDSHELFADTQIAKDSDYDKYLNKYNIIHLDIATFWDSHKEDLIEEIYSRVSDDIREICGDEIRYNGDLNVLLAQIYKKTRVPFVIIIDEWDCVIRNSNDEELVHKYLRFLHSIFKSEESKRFLALGYITGILPIKKIRDESALNNFMEYTMLDSYPITQYYGFTEDEVKALCDEYDLDYESMKAWYNGYLIDGIHMYNPNSVVEAISRHKYDSYWRNTSSFETLAQFISMNYDGLKDDVIAMMAGGKVKVNPRKFKNDLGVINSKDDALTALIHLGYLGYDSDARSAYIPNYEVASAYELAVEDDKSWNDVAKAIERCDDLLDATIDGDADTVAQIKDRRYQGVLNDYRGKILLVGVSYDKDSENKKHECVIEEHTGEIN